MKPVRFLWEILGYILDMVDLEEERKHLKEEKKNLTRRTIKLAWFKEGRVLLLHVSQPKNKGHDKIVKFINLKSKCKLITNQRTYILQTLNWNTLSLPEPTRSLPWNVYCLYQTLKTSSIFIVTEPPSWENQYYALWSSGSERHFLPILPLVLSHPPSPLKIHLYQCQNQSITPDYYSDYWIRFAFKADSALPM